MHADAQVNVTLPPDGEGEYQARQENDSEVIELPDVVEGKQQGVNNWRPGSEPRNSGQQKSAKIQFLNQRQADTGHDQEQDKRYQ